ncbi:NUDIX hydrolase [Pedobacter sp.]|nr:NUDIX hydrolase [Candidatus Saccharibacteria bacterium]
MITIFKPVGKALYYLTYPILRSVGVGMSGRRVRVQVLSECGTILLVKTWYGRQLWSLPGGGIERGESPEQAAVREVAEETAIEARVQDLELIGEMKATDGLPFDLVVFQLRLSSERLASLPRLRQFEIMERRWWPIAQLPESTSPVVAWSLGRKH